MSTSREHASRIQEQFNRQALAYARLDFASEMPGLRRVAKLAGAGPGDRVLDVACGPGFLTMALAETGASAVGIDITPAFLALGQAETRERGIERCKRVRGLVEQMPFTNRVFDIAVCRAAFHHFPSPAEVLAEMKRVTKSGGRVIVIDMVASADAAKAANQNAMERLCDPTHVQALSETAFHHLFADAGLTLKDTRYGETAYSLEAWLTHGGPVESSAAKIRGIFEEAINCDTLGLRVWRENGEIHFAHPGAAFVLKVD